jgi:hypothetical protein
LAYRLLGKKVSHSTGSASKPPFGIRPFRGSSSTVSIIIPTKDCGHALKRCMEGIRHQVHGFELELIVVDDEMKAEKARMSTAAQAMREGASEAAELRGRLAQLEAAISDKMETEVAFREELAARDDELDEGWLCGWRRNRKDPGDNPQDCLPDSREEGKTFADPGSYLYR